MAEIDDLESHKPEVVGVHHEKVRSRSFER